LREITKIELDSIARDVHQEIEKHESLHDLIEEAISADAESLEAELTERERHCDLQSALVMEIECLTSRRSAFTLGHSIITSLQIHLDSDKISSNIKESLQLIQSRFDTFTPIAMEFPTDEELNALTKTISDEISTLHDKLSEPTPAPATSSSRSSADPPVHPKVAPLNIDMPKFHGNPLDWLHFESLFTTTLRTRASSFCNADKCSLLSNAIKTEEGQQLLKSRKTTDTPVEDLIAMLRKRFGRPEIVVPLIIRKILRQPLVTDTYEGLKEYMDFFITGYRNLDHYIGDSLSQFLAYVSKDLFDTPIRDDWEKHVSGMIPKPTIDDLEQFFENRILHKTPAQSPAQPSTSSSPSTAALPFPALQSTPRPSLPPTANAFTPKKRPPLRCVACGDSHTLIRCTTFAGMDVDRRNKLIREKRLCINCFSTNHGFRTCPSKCSCCTCNNRHHTLLHKDRDSSPAAVNTLTVATSPAPPPDQLTTASESAPPTDQPNRPDPSFPNTITASLENNGRSAKARVMLDSGCGVSLMTEELATTLQLRRYPQAMSLTGLGNRVTSKFYVVTNLLSHSRSFSSQPITFAVVPRLIPSIVPANRDDILSQPALKDADLADPDTGPKSLVSQMYAIQ